MEIKGRVVDKEFYGMFTKYLIDIDGSDSIDGFGSKLYAFDMSAWGEKYHNGFVVDLAI